MSCAVTGVVNTSSTGTSATVTGVAIFQWTAVPTLAQNNTANGQRDALAYNLYNSYASVFASTGFAGAMSPDCSCTDSAVSAAFNSGFSYAAITGSGIPSAQCAATLTQTTAVGVDNGSVVPANKGKFCSSPLLVADGVAGTPGTGSCAVYGVATSAGTATATATGFTLATAALGSPTTGCTGLPTADAMPVGGSALTVTAGLGTYTVATAGVCSAVPAVVLTGTGLTGASVTLNMGLVRSAVTFVASPALKTTTGGATACTAAGLYTFAASGGTGGVVSVQLTASAVATTGGLTVSTIGIGYTAAPTTYTQLSGPDTCVELASWLSTNQLYIALTGVSTTTVAGTGATTTYTAVPDTTPCTTNVVLSNTAYTATTIAVTTPGSFTSVPAVTMTCAGGIAGTASVTVGVTAYTPVLLGSGYTAAPAVTISGGGGSGATAIASINAAGQLVGVFAGAVGTGYTSAPTVTLAAPTTSTAGALCADSTNFIAGVGIQTASGPSTTAGAPCAPLGFNYAPIALGGSAGGVCSTPAISGGSLGAVNVGTCNVMSSFIAQTGALLAPKCLVLPQSFTVVVTPAPTPAPAPAPKAPSPAAPAPSPVAPACTYGGNYRMEAVGRAACGVEFPSYYGGSPSNQTLCSTQSIQLRTEKQLPKLDRATFELTSTGEIKTVRRGCAAGEAVWTAEGEKLRLLTTTTPKWKIEASAGDCNLVAIKSTSIGTAAPYVSSPSPSGTQGCKSRQLFMTDKIYDTGRQLFRLRKF